MTGIMAEHLCKRYRVGVNAPSVGGTLADTLANLRRPRPPDLTVQALDDVSFTITGGEQVGIIGNNGAGKTTLLRILSRITEPTSGRAIITGKVAALLEVGAGLHPDLTGRENLRFLAALHGMDRHAVAKRSDEIIAFAGIERFLDLSVKRWSSGMAVRLAFAVAAHLDPDVLLLDEVLAVGDLAFQERCLGRMRDAAAEGRAVVLVSHSLQSVRGFCRRCLLIESGRLTADGAVDAVIDHYLSGPSGGGIGAITFRNDPSRRRGDGRARITSVGFAGADGGERRRFFTGDQLQLIIAIDVAEAVESLAAGLIVRTPDGSPLVAITHLIQDGGVKPGSGRITINIPRLALREGQYPLHLWIGDRHKRAYDELDGVLPPLHVLTPIRSDGIVEEAQGWLALDSTASGLMR